VSPDSHPAESSADPRSGVFVYFFLPELKGRSLEELDYMFEAGVATRSFRIFDTSDLVAGKRREHDTELESEKQGDKMDAEIEHVA
jgi:hypothetical protein